MADPSGLIVSDQGLIVITALTPRHWSRSVHAIAALRGDCQGRDVSPDTDTLNMGGAS